jgi:hypothetical protein
MDEMSVAGALLLLSTRLVLSTPDQQSIGSGLQAVAESTSEMPWVTDSSYLFP